MPRFIIGCRYWFSLIVLLVVIMAMLFSRHPSLPSYVIGFVAIAPSVALLLRLLNNKSSNIRVSLPVLIVGGIAIGLFAVASQGLLALHNGYPNALLTIPLFWWMTAVIVVLEPSRYYSLEGVIGLSGNHAKYLSLLIAPVLMLTWVAFTQFVSYKAQMLATGDMWCLRETDHMHVQSTWWLSPRKMLLENNYKGTTSPYLLLKIDDESWTHHWSFYAMDFVENETNAFLGALSFYKTSQIEKPC